MATETGGVTGRGPVTCQISISLDGYAAGPDQSIDDPLGKDGERLHEWAFGTDDTPVREIDAEVFRDVQGGVGAYIIGRRMFGGGDGSWDESWKGWWGDEPPYHAPVFVLTHYPREPLPMKGGTTFHFVTDGIKSALAQARAAAARREIAIMGGAATIQQYLRAGLIEELYLHVAPFLLGAGERLLEDVGNPRLDPIEVIPSPAVTHIKYRVSYPK